MGISWTQNTHTAALKRINLEEIDNKEINERSNR